MEGFPGKKEKLSNSERVRNFKRALFGAFLASIPATAEAADFGEGLDWSAGSKQMQELALTSQNEFAGLYTQVDGRGVWQNSVEGEHDTVSVNHYDEISTIIGQLLENDGNEAVVCRAHTHPNKAAEGYLYGPSQSDINEQIAFNKNLDDLLGELSLNIDVEGLIFGQHGVWYYSIDNPELSEVSKEVKGFDFTHDDLAKKFTTAIETGDTLKLQQGKLSMMLAYKQAGVSVRFSSYEDFANESPCLGTNSRR